MRSRLYINIITRSGDRMLNTVNDIIDISKIDSGQVEVENNEVNISVVIVKMMYYPYQDSTRDIR